LQDFVNLYGLYTDAGSLRAEVQRGGLWLNYVFLPVGRWGEAQIILLTVARLCLFVAEIVGHPWRSPQVLLRYAPDDPKPFIEFFGSGVRFGQPRDAFLIDHQTLSAPIAGADARRSPAGIRRKDLVGIGLQAQVKALLVPLLRHEGCSIDAAGRALGLSGRTLQRRLNAAGTSFTQIVDAVRADLAWRHVQRTDLSFALVAELLGYDSQAAFSRAFRRWYDMSPSRARRAPSQNTLP
jgi:AraC-like DNA-binding protein